MSRRPPGRSSGRAGRAPKGPAGSGPSRGVPCEFALALLPVLIVVALVRQLVSYLLQLI